MDLRICPYSSACRLAAAFCLLSLAGGCVSSTARTPYEQYQVVQAAATPVSINDMQAIENSAALILQPEQPVKTEITSNDSKIEKNNVQSNYKIFEFQGEADSRYKIELRSLCDCFGLDKFIMYPIARILDQNGHVVNNSPVDISLSDPDWNYPVNIRMVWEGEFEKSDKYYVLVSAYNDNVGENYLMFKEFDLLASEIQKSSLATAYLDLLNSVGNRFEEIRDPSVHPLWSFPVGKIVVTLAFDPN